MSGITTTGFSILNNVDNIDQPLLLWRSSSQWLGGLFFLIATIGTIGCGAITSTGTSTFNDIAVGGAVLGTGGGGDPYVGNLMAMQSLKLNLKNK